jgi:hypothetical protein
MLDAAACRYSVFGHAGKVIRDLIAAATCDSTEEAAADARFAEIFITNAFPSPDPDA